jgi:hypothetical protein
MTTKRFFIDTEFIESGPAHPIDLISIGVVCEDGREFYAQNLDCDLSKANDWVRANVLPHLADFDIERLKPYGALRSLAWCRHATIRDLLCRFVGDDTPEWWGSCSAYDHVALCQLFGRMIDLPKGWPFLTLDLQQWAHHLGLPRDWDESPDVGHVGTAHNARWTRKAWAMLHSIARKEF